jgi:beta propeller repeat protein
MNTNLLHCFLSISGLLSVSFLSLSGQRPGIECGCKKYGEYVEPTSKGIVVEQGSEVQEGSSSKGKYTLEIDDAIAPNEVNITIYYKGILIFNENHRATGWGFSPDEDKFAMHGIDQFGNPWCRLADLDPDPSREGEWTESHFLVEPTDFSSVSIRFSPHGKYLLYAAILGPTGDLFLKVFDTRTREVAYNGSTSSLIGSPSGKSVAGWGFSSDNKDATFVHAYLTDVDRYTLVVKNLKTPAGDYVLFSTNTQGEAHWFFSQCGDYFAWLYDNPLSGSSGNLYRTDIENSSLPIPAITWWKMVSNKDGHYIKYQNGDSTQIVENTADETCPDVSKPTWENAILETGLVEGTTMELHWDGDTDNIEVTAFKIYQDDEEIKEIEAVRRYTVTELEPDTEYKFSIEAGDETGNWSTTGPEKKFRTFPDNEPSWPDPAINHKDITETKITLTWNAALDDYGITFYKILVNGEEIHKVGGDTLKYRIRGLTADSTYTFRIMAGDAAGQWIPSADLIYKMPPAVPPYWPEDSVLSAKDITETSMTVKWPAANDYYNQVKYYRIIMNGDILNPKYKLTYYPVDDLEEGTAYEFEVVAIDESDGESEPLTGILSTLASYVVSPLIADSADQKRPDISGNLVVWWDERNDGGDIYSYDLETDDVKRITDNPAIQFNPTVDGERIVWTDTRNGTMDIFMYDPEDGEQPICTAAGDQDLAAIDGDIIVWRDGRNGNWDIYMYDLSTKQESAVSTRTSNQNWPDISTNYVIYADDRNGNWDIFMYRISTQEEFTICTNTYAQTFPVISGGPYIGDLTIAYMDDRSGKNIYIYYPYYFGSSGYEYLVPLDKTPIISTQAYPHFDNSQLVYQDLYGVNDGVHYSIWAYQFVNDVYGKRKEISIDLYADQTRPRTSQGNIVWQYEKNGESDIYIWKRPPGSDLKLSVKENKDPLVPGDTLRYYLTILNDGPNTSMFVKTECVLPVLAKFDTAFTDKGTLKTEGLNLSWEIDALRNQDSATLEIVFVTYDIALLELTAITTSGIFDPDPSNNRIHEFTKVKNSISQFVDHGSTPTLVTEPGGRVHLLYIAGDSLMYATKPYKGKWEYRLLDNCPSCRENDMILDRDGNLQMAISSYNYDTYPRGWLYHGTLAKEGVWSKKIIAVSDIGFHSLSIKADSQNELYLVYQQAHSMASGGALKEMRTIGGVWNHPEIFSSGYDHVDMTLDKEDNMHVSYYAMGLGIGYQKKSAGLTGTWSTAEVVEPGWRGAQLEGMCTSIVTDSSNNPHISYVGRVDDEALENNKYAWKSNNQWNIIMVDKGHFQSRDNEIVLDDPTGAAHFSYVYFPTGEWGYTDLKYATNIAGPWIKEILDENCGVLDISMGRDSYKNTHIAFSGGYAGRIDYILLPPITYFKITPESLDFGPVEPGSTKTLTLKLTNPQSKDIIIDAIKITDDRFSLSKTKFILNKYESDSLSISFKQNDIFGVDTFLTIWYNSPSDLYMDIPVKVKGWEPELTVDQDPINFGAVPKNILTTKTVSLKNTGATDLIISNIEVKYEPWSGYVYPTDFSLIGHNCTTLQPDESCEVQIGFQPVKDGSQYSNLNITSNDAENSLKEVSITGYTSVPQIYPSKDMIDFGYCPNGQSLVDSVILVNTGDAVLNITSMTLSGTDYDQFAFGNHCTSLNPKDSCIINVTFSPTRLGDLQVNLAITSNSQYSNLLNIALIGSSYIRTLELSTELINFGNINVGEDSNVLLELRNTGSVDLTISNIQLTGADVYEFSHNHGCYVITAGTTCVDTVRFIPLFEGAKTASLIISSNDSYEPEKTVVLTGQAGEVLPLQLEIGADPVTGVAPLHVSFNSFVMGGQPPYQYLWNFRDGSTSTDKSPVHEFISTGMYSVTCIVTDVNMQTEKDSVEVAVGSENVPAVVASAEPSSGYVPLTVYFNAAVSGGNAPVSFSWDFDDGSLSQIQNPVHGFSFPGLYNVKVTVTDEDGDIAKDSVMITVQKKVSIEGEIRNQEGNGYIDKSTVILYPENWQFGTYTLQLDQNHTYLFADIGNGNYTVYVIPDSAEYPGYLPTYLGNTLLLSDASWVSIDNVVSGQNINMIRKPDNTVGTGTITGTFIEGETGNKIAVAFKPVLKAGSGIPDCYVFLKDAVSGDLESYDMTGNAGNFNFDSLLAGSYMFEADYLGLPMDPSNVTLELLAENDSLEILAIAGISNITIELVETGSDNLAYNKDLKIYPVPASDRLVVEIANGALVKGLLKVSIYNLSGNQLIAEYPFIAGEKSLELDISKLEDGFYLLRIEDKVNSYEFRFVKAY